MLRVLPMGLFGAFLGALAERIERRTALVSVVLSMGLTSMTLAVLAFTGQLAVWQLAVASFINGIGWATDNPVRRVMIGEVVGAEQMSTAMSIDVGTNNASRMRPHPRRHIARHRRHRRRLHAQRPAVHPSRWPRR